MQKEDFSKGQTVYVLLIGDAARGRETADERIQEWEVLSVGRKYITACPKSCSNWDTKFEIKRNFRQVCTYGSEDYVLYLSREEILRDLRKKDLVWEVSEKCGSLGKLSKLSLEQLEKIYEILQ